MKKLLIAVLLAVSTPFAFAADRIYVQIVVKPPECKRVGDLSASIPLAALKGAPVSEVVNEVNALAEKEQWSPDMLKLAYGLVDLWFDKSAAEMMFGQYKKDVSEPMVDMMGDKAERICVKDKGIMYLDARVARPKTHLKD